ncbi:hypothetical protein [Chromobacterium subtsugae]|uniref:hypothetical protein n=1 Tax=Chromobacterium subtsugae TaxID=251747 RepID=UPI000640CA52|nr:hypothetical protein [Chromobacterium subtsugae]
MKYLYSGPVSGVTLQVDGAAREVMFYPGCEVDLPESNEYTQTLQALDYLVAVDGQARPGRTAARSTPSDETVGKGA